MERLLGVAERVVAAYAAAGDPMAIDAISSESSDGGERN
jgi:hypothetical protein